MTTATACAKINLMLHVNGRRDDGYHLLQSLVIFTDFGDILTYQPAPDFSLKIHGAFSETLHTPSDNLVSKAAHALAACFQQAPHGALQLEKNIPVGAGLGGGSADAALALALLAKEWKLTPASSDIATIAQSLGSDVLACSHSAPLWMEGTGERITPLVMNFELPILLVNPRVEVSTPAVYRSLTPPYDTPMLLPERFASLAALINFLRHTHNALQPPALKIAPIISNVLGAIETLPNCLLARMSGSGATCFGLFPTQEACTQAEHLLQHTHPHWWSKATYGKTQ